MLTTFLDDLYDLNRDINRIFDTYPARGYYRWPEINIYNNNDEYIVVAKTPGLKKEDVSITLKDNALKITGERKKEEKGKSNIHLEERYTGKFERSFMLNEKVDAEKVDAEMKNGLLIVKLPKSPETKAKAITIK